MISRHFFICMIFFLLLNTVVFVSCSKKQEKENDVSRTELGKRINELSENADWSFQLEGERLTRRIDRLDNISASVPLSPSALIVMEPELKSIYPSVPGFTVLDVSKISGEILSLVKGFSEEFISYRKDERNRLTAGFRNTKKEADSENDNSEEELSGDSKILDYFSKETSFSLILFLYDTENAGEVKDYLIGEPFVSEETIEVPVRFTTSKEILYTYLYPVEKESSWKLEQIEIYKREDIDGEH